MMLTERQKVRKRWVKALRSGKYKQTMGYLHEVTTVEEKKEHSFCCLGVLCDLAVKAKVIPSGRVNEVESESESGTVAISYLRQTGGLPNVVRKWAGLTDGQGEFYEDKDSYDVGATKSLAELNDNGQSFSTIANIIESEPYKLCVKEKNANPKRSTR